MVRVSRLLARPAVSTLPVMITARLPWAGAPASVTLVTVNSRSHVWIARAVAARSRWAVAALAGWSINSRQSEP
jgi:hypothetical protein